tara:strand:- start:942 stop:1454 length:513 start_codon:yes stop_codon:yes gene_type:complete
MIITDFSLQPLIEILDNAVLAWGLIACGLAQLSKLIVELIQHGKWRPAVLVETGGMPSSHSAFVTGTASGVGLQLGFDHPSFAVAATIAFVVMYDASGIRRASGLIATRLNELPSDSWPSPPSRPLKESLGHTKLEVLVGSFIGPAVALPGIIFFGSPIHIAGMLGLMIG